MKNKYFKNLYYDSIYMFLPPLLCCILIYWFSSLERFSIEVLGYKFLVLSIFLFLIEGMGDTSTLFRAYLNKKVFNNYKYRLIFFPIVVFILTLVSVEFMVFLFILELFWDIWHSAMQNWGVSRIYEAKNGDFHENYRSLDKWMNIFIYIGPMLIFLTLSPEFYGADFLNNTGFSWFISIVDILTLYHYPIIVSIIISFIFFIILYGNQLRKDFNKGYQISRQKFIFFGSWLLLSIYANSLGGIYGAFIAVNVAHSIQTLGISWWSEKDNIKNRFKLTNRSLFIVVSLFILILGSYEWWASSVENFMYMDRVRGDDISKWFEGPFGLLVRLRLTTNILHYWADSFIWSIRKKELKV